MRLREFGISCYLVSVSIVAIPLVKTMGVVMGKKGFANWAASLLFINKEEFLVTISGAVWKYIYKFMA